MDTSDIIIACEKMITLRRARVRKVLMQQGLHLGQPEMLLYVRLHPGCSQRQMADDAGVTPASIAASFKRMENAGLIRRRQDTADTRCNRVYITDKGINELEASLRAMDLLNDHMLDGIEPEDLAAFCRCMAQINRNLSPEHEK